MGNVLEYKGYQTKVEYDAESHVLYGKIEGIRDLVNFEADTLQDVERFFHEAVDDYLEFCKEVGKTPDKTYNGQFNIRIPSQLHRELAMRAFRNGETLNKEVQNAIEQYVNGQNQSSIPSIIIVHPNENKGVFNSGKNAFGDNFGQYLNYSRVQSA